MKRLPILIILIIFVQKASAQNISTSSSDIVSEKELGTSNKYNKDEKNISDDTKKVKKDKKQEEEEIKLSDSFMKALDGAFSFGQEYAPLPKQENDLTREQLHEWVGEPNERDTSLQVEKFDSTYKNLKRWEKEFYTVLNLRPSSIELGVHFGKISSNRLAFDFGEMMASFLNPNHRKLKKQRERTKKTLEALDAAFPMVEKR